MNLPLWNVQEVEVPTDGPCNRIELFWYRLVVEQMTNQARWFWAITQIQSLDPERYQKDERTCYTSPNEKA